MNDTSGVGYFTDIPAAPADPPPYVLTDDDAVVASIRAASLARRIARMEQRAKVAIQTITTWADHMTGADRRTLEQLLEQLDRFVLVKREQSGGATKFVDLPGGRVKTTESTKVDYPDDAENLPSGRAALFGEEYADKVEIPVRYRINPKLITGAITAGAIPVDDTGRVLIDGEDTGIRVRKVITAKFVPGQVTFPDADDETGDEWGQVA